MPIILLTNKAKRDFANKICGAYFDIYESLGKKPCNREKLKIYAKTYKLLKVKRLGNLPPFE